MYTDNKAPTTAKPWVDPKALKPGEVTPQSNQELAVGTGARPYNVGVEEAVGEGYMASNRKMSNQLKMGPNTKGTNVLKDPIAKQTRYTLAAVSNPEAQDLSGVRTAPKAK